MNFIFRQFLVLVICFATMGKLHVDHVQLWSLGTWDGDPQDEYGDANGYTEAPGSASALDNDFYFAGIYPAPIGTVGLWELNPDGSWQLDGSGHPVPTYSNAEITQLARVMTGFWFGGHIWSSGGWTEQDYATPMSLQPSRHDFGAKTLLQGYIIPARAANQENAERDVHDAIGHLFNHPNTGVFVGKQLI